MGFKQVTFNRCEQFKTPFSPLALMKQLNLQKHLMGIEEIVNRCKTDKREISYLGSLVIAPEKKNDKELNIHLLDLFIALQFFFANEHSIHEGIVGTTLRFKTDRLARTLGYSPLSLKGEELPPVSVPFVYGDLSQFHHRIGFSKEAETLASRFRQEWEDVIYLANPIKEENKVAA
jgi:hypothetical protein